jgi:hypothetical protein
MSKALEINETILTAGGVVHGFTDTYTETFIAPEPVSSALIGAGLVVLASLGRRRARKRNA